MTDPDYVKRRAFANAPTVLESFFWGWLCGYGEFDQYLDELHITDLRGPGHLPCEERGDWDE